MNGREEIPVWKKPNLTLEEAASYFGIGINTLRDMANEGECDWVLWVRSKRLIKRKKLEEFLESQFSV